MKIRTLFLLCILLLTSEVVMSPTIEFQMKFARIRQALDYLERQHYEMEFIRFVNDLGHNESLNNWLCINRIGCFGEWQFAESTLHCLGFRQVTLRKFRKNPGIFPREMQQKALESLIKVNLALLRDYDHYIGDTIKGVVVTKSGLIAAAHLGGAGSTKRFLKSGGKANSKDALGTSIHDYMRKFRNYDLE
ncbi:MAG: hypothetical protein GYA41_12180 [Bacteroidales bacterium]|nr:hypothetical protein [Bacteroidales bacterium]